MNVPSAYTVCFGLDFLSLGASALSAALQQHDTNRFIVLFSLEPLIVLAAVLPP